jgi:Protein of unknown function (DUF2490)
MCQKGDKTKIMFLVYQSTLKKIIIISSLLISTKAFTQRPPTGLWLTAQFPLHINNKWQVVNDFNYRTLGSSFNALQQLYRAGVKYNVNRHWSATAGAAVSFTRTSFTKVNKEFAKEFRWWQEVNYKNEFTKTTTAQLRIRTEERTFTATNSKAGFHAFRYRIRPQLQQKLSTHWSVFIANEYMQQHTKGKWSFDQNRFIINGIYAFKNKAQINAGYMWLLWPANSNQHILTIGFQKPISLHAK